MQEVEDEVFGHKDGRRMCPICGKPTGMDLVPPNPIVRGNTAGVFEKCLDCFWAARMANLMKNNG